MRKLLATLGIIAMGASTFAAVADAATLAPLERIGRPALLALAVRFGQTRLIDNVTLRP